jgi:hypothetical protein
VTVAEDTTPASLPNTPEPGSKHSTTSCCSFSSIVLIARSPCLFVGSASSAFATFVSNGNAVYTAAPEVVACNEGWLICSFSFPACAPVFTPARLIDAVACRALVCRRRLPRLPRSEPTHSAIHPSEDSLKILNSPILQPAPCAPAGVTAQSPSLPAGGGVDTTQCAELYVGAFCGACACWLRLLVRWSSYSALA